MERTSGTERGQRLPQELESVYIKEEDVEVTIADTDEVSF
jgi:hypothetical protein